MATKAGEEKVKTEKLDFIKMKNLRGLHQASERQLTPWEEIFANPMPDKRISSRLQ